MSGKPSCSPRTGTNVCDLDRCLYFWGLIFLKSELKESFTEWPRRPYSCFSLLASNPPLTSLSGEEERVSPPAVHMGDAEKQPSDGWQVFILALVVGLIMVQWDIE